MCEFKLFITFCDIINHTFEKTPYVRNKAQKYIKVLIQKLPFPYPKESC